MRIILQALEATYVDWATNSDKLGRIIFSFGFRVVSGTAS